ncbi:MAG TPA: hypothetical protein VGS62_01235 [Streptosporangiaceae bacterium]|nr:hypothetical protein [Streptosporangiaceae bacterium]
MDQIGRVEKDDGPREAGEHPGGAGSSPTVTAEQQSGEAGAPAEPTAEPAGAQSQRGGRSGRAGGWMRSAVTRHLVILIGYLGAGFLFTWPRLTYLYRHKLPSTRDAGAYVWGFWWVARQVEHLSNPWYTHYIAAPVGVQLGFHALMPLPGVLMMPVTLAFGPSASYNLLSALMPGLLCYVMYRLARLWVRSETAAIAAGALYGLSSMLAFQSFYILNVATGPLFMPLALEAVVRLRRAWPGGGRPAWRKAVALGVIMGAALLTDQEGFILVAIVVVLALLPWLLSRPAKPEARAEIPAGAGAAAPAAAASWERSVLARLWPVALAALVTLVIGSPQLIAMAQQVAAHGTSIDPHLLAVSYTDYGVGLPGLFAPSPRIAGFGLYGLGSEYYYHGILYRPAGPHGRLLPTGEATPMFGFMLSVLALAGLVAAWRRRSAWMLALLWVGAALLALGPVLWIGRNHKYVPFAIDLHGVRVSALMPYTWFVQIPGLSSFREATRLAELGMVAAALLAATAINWLRYHARPVMVGALALAVLELGWTGNLPARVMPPILDIKTMPTAMPKLNNPIIADHSDSIVVDFPFGIRGGIPLYGQGFDPESQVLATANGHPLADGFISRVPAPTISGVQAHSFYAGLLTVWSDPDRWSHLDHQTLLAVLAGPAADARRMDIGWVVVWPTHVPNAINRYLTGTGFKLAYRVHGVKVYRPVDRPPGS